MVFQEFSCKYSFSVFCIYDSLLFHVFFLFVFVLFEVQLECLLLANVVTKLMKFAILHSTNTVKSEIQAATSNKTHIYLLFLSKFNFVKKGVNFEDEYFLYWELTIITIDLFLKRAESHFHIAESGLRSSNIFAISEKRLASQPRLTFKT